MSAGTKCSSSGSAGGGGGGGQRGKLQCFLSPEFPIPPSFLSSHRTPFPPTPAYTLLTQGTPIPPPPPSFLAPLFADPIKFSQLLEDLLGLIGEREGGRRGGRAEGGKGVKGTAALAAPAAAAPGIASSHRGGVEGTKGDRGGKFAYLVGVEEVNASSVSEGTERLGQALAPRLGASFFSLQLHHPSSTTPSSLILPSFIPASTPASPPSVLLCAAWVGEGNGALIAGAVQLLETRGFR